MSKAKNGDKVKVHYTGKLEDGAVFDSSREKEPLEFEIGAKNVIPGFEQSVIGMGVGESKSLTILPDDAYGPRREGLLVEVMKKDIPEDITPENGGMLPMRQPDGHVIDVMISEISEDKVTLDANHPLAGETLCFDVELMKID